VKLGIDFGTTRIVVAAVQSGNYPVVNFEGPEGASRDWFPPLVAVAGDSRRYGWEAWVAQAEPGTTVVRSLKRYLADAGPSTRVEIGPQTLPMRRLLAELMAALKQALLETSTLGAGQDEPLEVVLGVPANANSNQRFLTVEAFREAGFAVLGLLNEPSAASIEFSHRSRSAARVRDAGSVLVYDLGGGTFDASLVAMDERTHSVIGTEGIGTLGGDDFDDLLAELALEAARVPADQREGLSQAEAFRLQEECREKKEGLSPNTRRLIVDLDVVREGWGEVSVPVPAYFERCRALIDETLHAVDDLLEAHGFAPDGASASPDTGALEAVYVTGGGSELPAVARALRDRFARKTRRSAQARSATAVGLAIRADAHAGYVVRERFTRYFGVWREAEAGHRITFDPLFLKGTPLPGPGERPLVRQREYSPVHNVGHFRYLECAQLEEDGTPTGELTLWDEIRFPFDPALREVEDLSAVPVVMSEAASNQRIEELYACEAGGTVAVTIVSSVDGHSRRYRLGRWAAKEAPLRPGRRKRRR
jgi:molecular chaperone DnaK (HSP70)